MSHYKILRLWQKMHEQRHAVEDAKALQLRAIEAQVVEIARRNIERRLMEMNEVRSQINSERGHYIQREMHDKQFEALRDSIDARLKPLEQVVANYQGRMVATGAIITFVLALLEIGLHYFH